MVPRCPLNAHPRRAVRWHCLDTGTAHSESAAHLSLLARWQLSNWPLKLINFDDVRFAPIGDGFDADDDFHRLPRQAGNASILDTQTAYPRFLTLAPVQD